MHSGYEASPPERMTAVIDATPVRNGSAFAPARAAASVVSRRMALSSPAPCTAGCAARHCSTRLVPERGMPMTNTGAGSAPGAGGRPANQGASKTARIRSISAREVSTSSSAAVVNGRLACS